MARVDRAKEAALAAAAAGAAAVGGAALVRRTRSTEDARRLRSDETVPDGIRRIARLQLGAAHGALNGAGKRRLGASVHTTRKELKRVRTELRLVRPAIGSASYRRANADLRSIGRRLSGARDAQVLLETLADLQRRFVGELPSAATAALAAQLNHERREAMNSLRESPTIATTVEALAAARTEIVGWVFERGGFDALRPGLRRIYARGRRAMRAAERDPGTDNLHDWRKRVKDLWHAGQLMRPALPPKTVRRAHRLADLLGADHDLAVLRERVENDTVLLGAIDRRRCELQREAFAIGAVLYRRKPRRFVARVERRWHTERAKSG